jgi:SM-20-related protein
MPTADFFARLGVLVIKNFLEVDLCRRICAEARESPGGPAWVVNQAEERVDESVRRTRQVKVSRETSTLVKNRLLAIEPQVESHFHLTLSDCEKPVFLVYREGDFFVTHQDSDKENQYFEVYRNRRVSAVVFLNGESADPGPESYTGGSLTLYGLIDQPQWKTRGFPVVGEPGLLIAFRSDVIHEVTPVTRGERFTAVTWYN